MTNYAVGHLAEKYAVDYLEGLGYEVLDTNWKTRYCEIDVIAKHSKIIYFVEVKYRKTSEQGTGLDYITDFKLRQMRFAAEMWVSEHGWSGDYNLAVLELSGPDFKVTNFLTEL